MGQGLMRTMLGVVGESVNMTHVSYAHRYTRLVINEASAGDRSSTPYGINIESGE